MECEVAGEQIGAWIDRQLLPEQAAALEAHLSTCVECRAAAEALRAQDADLLRAFQPGRAAARRVAAAAIAELNVAQRKVAELHREPPVNLAPGPLPGRR